MTSCYTNKELYRVVSLHPWQMRNGIKDSLMENLQPIVGHCVEGGYIMKIYNIVKYTNGILPGEDFAAVAKYDVIFNAKICCPIDGSVITCQIITMNPTLLEAKNGPIKILVERLKHSPVNFSINSSGNLVHTKTKHIVKQNDYVNVKITGKQFNINDKYILVLADVEDLASDKEIKEMTKDIEEQTKTEFVDPDIVNQDIEEETTKSADDHKQSKKSSK